MQINFGVILNESMADAVKITVIATGFQPENLPQLARRITVNTEVIPEPPPPAPAPVLEPVLTSGSLFREMAAPPPPPPVMQEPEPAAVDDIEVPAFLRRERRLYQ